MRLTLWLGEIKESHIFEVNRQHKQTIQVVKDRSIPEVTKKVSLSFISDQ